MAYRVTEIRRVNVGAMRPAIGRYQSITARLITLAGVDLIKNQGELRRLDDLPWRARAWDSERFAVESWIGMNCV
jgi:hypothetical protein